METLVGKVIKKHSDFVYVKSGDNLFECKVRERIKKEKVEILVGDNVKIEEINPETSQAVIIELLERDNFITRPSAANVDQIVIVASISEPELDYIQLNRYLCHAKLHNIEAIICVNKIDLKKNVDKKEEVCSIYQPLGYKIVFTSAVDGSGMENLKKILKDKISVLSGMSGVGKSSLLNKLCPDLNLKTKHVSQKSKKGIHTTRHVELISINNEFFVADTPGFSYLKFDTIMPNDVDELFDEIKELSEDCFFSDCLHLQEKDCNVINNLDKINKKRYESYKIFVEESFEFKKKLTQTGTKKEEVTKYIDAPGRKKTKIIKTGKKDESRYCADK